MRDAWTTNDMQSLADRKDYKGCGRRIRQRIRLVTEGGVVDERRYCRQDWGRMRYAVCGMRAVCGTTRTSARDGRHGKQSAIWLVWQGQSQRLLESHIRGLAAGRRSRPRPGAVALRVLAPSRPALGSVVVGGDGDRGRTHASTRVLPWRPWW